MTPQQAFDTTVAHILTQGVPAISKPEKGPTTCMYKTESGLKCAAGCLISDEDYATYQDVIEGIGFTDVAAKIPALQSLSPETLALIKLVQNAHDDSAFLMRKYGTPFLEGFATYLTNQLTSRKFDINKSVLLPYLPK